MITNRLATFCVGLVGTWLLLSSPLQAKEGVPVVLAAVQQQTIYYQVQITGSVTSPNAASLSSATSGLVAALHVDEGDQVTAGTVLMELDAELANLQWQSAKAQQAQARSALSDSRRRLKEAQRLSPQRGIAETVVRGLEAEVTLDMAVLDQAKADAAYQQAILDRHKLRAPFAGVISQRLVGQGEWINPGDGVVELVATENLRLDFAVPEDYLAQLHPDTIVQFSVNALPDETFEGLVKTIVPVTDLGARTFLLRVVPKMADSRITPGLSARATLYIPTERQGLVIPRDAMLRYQDGRVIVWSVERGEKGLVAKENLVQVGQSFAGKVEVHNGLAVNAQVVVRGNESLRNGQLVRGVSNDANGG